MASSYRVRNNGYAETSTPLSAVNQALTIQTDPNGSAMVQVLSATSLAGCTLVAEGRISSTAPWTLLSLSPTQQTTKTAGLAVTPALTGVPTTGWYVSCNGLCELRVRVSAITGGSLHVGIRLSDEAFT